MTNLFRKGLATSSARLTLLSILFLGCTLNAFSQAEPDSAAEPALTTTGDPASTVIPGTYFGLTVQHSDTVPC